jgi:hypothetical protein
MGEGSESAREPLPRAEVNLCIFPHLKEFLVIDLRGEDPRVRLLSTEEVFGEGFFKGVEEAFSRSLREETRYPFAHFLALPMRVEEMLREMAVLAILERLNEGQPVREVPKVAIFIVSGTAVSLTTDQLTRVFEHFLGSRRDPRTVAACVEAMEGLMAREKEILKELEREEIKEALRGESPRFFTLWESSGP